MTSLPCRWFDDIIRQHSSVSCETATHGGDQRVREDLTDGQRTRRLLSNPADASKPAQRWTCDSVNVEGITDYMFTFKR